MNKIIKQLPDFKNEDEEREFWAKNSPLDYFDLSTAKIVEFPNLKPSTKSISLRLPQKLLNIIKIEAGKRDMPYQSLIKAKLYESFVKTN